MLALGDEIANFDQPYPWFRLIDEDMTPRVLLAKRDLSAATNCLDDHFVALLMPHYGMNENWRARLRAPTFPG